MTGPIDALPAVPRDREGPVFREPWEAQAFGLTLALHEAGHFTWREWVDSLTQEIAAVRSRNETDDGTRYYEYWLSALEKLVARKGLLGTDELTTRKFEWDVAARTTPHGRPIELRRPSS